MCMCVYIHTEREATICQPLFYPSSFEYLYISVSQIVLFKILMGLLNKRQVPWSNRSGEAIHKHSVLLLEIHNGSECKGKGAQSRPGFHPSSLRLLMPHELVPPNQG